MLSPGQLFYWYFLRVGLVDAFLKAILLVAFGRTLYLAARRKQARLPSALAFVWLWTVMIAAFDLYYLPRCLMTAWQCMRELTRAFMLNFSVALALTMVVGLIAMISTEDKIIRRTYLSLSLLALAGVVLVVVWAQVQFWGLDQLTRR